ncbi:centrosomal protein of 78 kDa-like [Eucyclogobius newberryi]|uniref:centrosomal protein of 78 kDa-like n=1 Tax=Eucyclogobius newberryi TaxID=166745 RepID=UPI003B5C0E88
MQRSNMVQDSAQIRRRGAHDFLAYYDFVCARQESVPLRAVTMNLDKGMLDFNGDRIKLSDWPPILDSISINKQLHHIAISSTYQSLVSGDADRRFYKPSMKKKIPAICSKEMTFKLSKTLRNILNVSPNLKTLQLNSLLLRERDLIVLTKGLAKSVSLENLSLANCPISDEGLEIICQSVKYSTSIRTVDFTGCNLTWRAAEHMANIIKHQGMQRHGTAWAESLRYRQPQFERMSGLRRVTLNCNTLIGDRGAAALANELAEDLWVKAVDLQRCGLSNEGARRLLESLKTNSTLSVLDVRSNPLIDKVIIKTILEKVLMNAGESPEYKWIKPTVIEPQRTAALKRQRHTVRKASSPVVGGPRVTHQKPCLRSRCVPWRTAARAGRQRCLPPGATVVDQNFQGAATVKVTVETDSEDEDDEEAEVVVEVEEKPSSSAAEEKLTERHLQMALRECRLMLSEERRARLRAESRLKEFEQENARLRTANLSLTETLAHSATAPEAFSALEDEAVLESIENSFKKFHAFLDLLKDAGLGQIVSMAGLEQSDFQPIGKPQLSSTHGPSLDAAVSLDRQVNPFGDTQTETDPPEKAPSPPPIAQIVAMPTKSSSPSEASSHRDKLLGGTFTQAAKSPGVPGVSGEATDQHSKLLHKSDSEQSIYSQRSLEDFRKTNQTPRSLSPHSKSNHSNSYHRYSDGSHSSGRLSSKSSISEVISERVESVRSSGSSKGEEVNLRFKGHLGSGGSIISSENERDNILSQITYLRGAQSFNYQDSSINL